MVVGIAGATVLALALAFLLRGTVRTSEQARLIVIIAGLAIVSAPLAVAAYTFLRDDELEPYRGRALLVRAALCGLAYALLWAAYAMLAANGILTGEAWQWLFVAPVFISLGAAAAWATLDLDFGSAAMHYAFYVLVTMLLGFALGLPPLWAAGSATA
jgi:hypothetical protein